MTTQPPPSPGPQDNPYAAPPASPYTYPRQQDQAYRPYAGRTYGPPAYSPYATEYYAHWGRRVRAYLLDYLLILPGWLLAVIGVFLTAPSSGSRSRATSAGSSVGVGRMLAGYALMLGLTIWNRYVRAGRTGQSWGKKVLGIRLVRESHGWPIGAGMAFVRDLAH